VRLGKFDPERWERAKELAEQGCWLSEAARILKIHHTTAIYISRQMGFKWPPCPERYARFKPGRKYYSKKPPIKFDITQVSDEPLEYVDLLMRLAGAA